jgi:ABC-type transport system involved in cytochrome bd biosynthesis fused ATPase/permease subunit
VESFDAIEPVPAPVNGDLSLNKLQAAGAEGQMLLNLHLAAGSVVAASAANGHLQSLFCRLLCRDAEVRGGAMRLGELDLLACSLPQQRQLLRVLDRQTLVPMTIRAYLTLADRQVTPSRMHEVLSLLDLDACIRELPDGLDTELSYSAAPLLLDQALRLKLAYALLGSTQVLVLTQIFDCVTVAQLRTFIEAWQRSGRILIVFSQRELPGMDTSLELHDNYLTLTAESSGKQGA